MRSRCCCVHMWRPAPQAPGGSSLTEEMPASLLSVLGSGSVSQPAVNPGLRVSLPASCQSWAEGQAVSQGSQMDLEGMYCMNGLGRSQTFDGRVGCVLVTAWRGLSLPSMNVAKTRLKSVPHQL